MPLVCWCVAVLQVGMVKCADQGPFVLPPGSAPSGSNKSDPHTKNNGYAWCSMEVDKDDSVLFGQQVRDNCVNDLKLAAGLKQDAATSRSGGGGGSTNYSKPFFIGCGFHKPHAPYYAPKEFFDRLPGWPVKARQKKKKAFGSFLGLR